MPTVSKSNRWWELLLSLLLLGVGLGLGWRVATTCFDQVGPWWRGRVQGNFVETTAQVDKVYFQRTQNAKHVTTLSRNIMVVGRYLANTTEYKIVGIYEVLYNSSDQESAVKALKLGSRLRSVTVYYDPAQPAFAVLHTSSIPGLAEVAIMGLLGCTMLVMCGALVFLGGAGFLVFLTRGSSALPASLTMKRHTALSKHDVAPITPRAGHPSQFTKCETAELTGDAATDYYSGALARNAISRWEGNWCELYLLAGKVIVAYDESTHHHFESLSLEAVLNQRNAIYFADYQQQEHASFLKAVHQAHHGQ